jgi:hypothetical protein
VYAVPSRACVCAIQSIRFCGSILGFTHEASFRRSRVDSKAWSMRCAHCWERWLRSWSFSLLKVDTCLPDDLLLGCYKPGADFHTMRGHASLPQRIFSANCKHADKAAVREVFGGIFLKQSSTCWVKCIQKGIWEGAGDRHTSSAMMLPSLINGAVLSSAMSNDAVTCQEHDILLCNAVE